MKRLSIICLSILLAMSLSVTAWAVTKEELGETKIPVTATYQENNTMKDVYSVDITWGSMDFIYQVGSGSWNPSTHSYSSSEGWVYAEDANKITIVNHSNVSVKCSLEYQSLANTVSGDFSQADITLPSAEGTNSNNPPTDSATLTLDGALSKGTSEAKIGTITVTIAKS